MNDTCKNYRNLELVDPEATKTNLMYKWVVKVMEPKESNLQIIFMYKLARFNSQRGRSRGLA